jgi:nucleoside-diphosphate-sugar epimerase
MKVFLVGSSGLIGGEIYKKLLSNGYDLVTLDRNQTRGSQHQRLKGDIHKPDSYLELLRQWQPNIVISTSWITDKNSYRTSSHNWEYAESTINLARNAYRYGVQHFIGLGSCAELGFLARKEKPVSGADTYADSKSFTFNQIQSISIEAERRFTWGRVFQVYGRGQDSNRLIPQLASSLSNGQQILLANPYQVFDWITSRDVASAIEYSIKMNLPTEIEIGTGIGTSVKAISEEAARILNSSPNLLQFADEPYAHPDWVSVIARTSSPLLTSGWKPNDNVSSGLSWMLSL